MWNDINSNGKFMFTFILINKVNFFYRMHQRNQLCPVQLLTEKTIQKIQVENVLNNKKIHLSRNRKLGIRQAFACMCSETKCLMNNEIVTNWCVLFIFHFILWISPVCPHMVHSNVSCFMWRSLTHYYAQDVKLGSTQWKIWAWHTFL